MAASIGGNPRLDRIEKLIEQSELANKKARVPSKSDMRRWVAFAAKDDRNQRKRSAEIDKKIGQLAAAQLITEEGLQELRAAQVVTEETLRRFISSLGRSGNGH